MNTLVRAFYSAALWFSSFQLAIAKSAPEPNHQNIKALRHDISEYEGVIDRVDLGVMTEGGRAADSTVLTVAVTLVFAAMVLL